VHRFAKGCISDILLNISSDYFSCGKENDMLVEFSIIPVGAGSSIGDHLAEILKMVDESGLPYKVNPMGTVVEGEWDDLISLVGRCHKTILENSDRVYTTLSIDDRKDKPNRLEEKVKSVEQRIGKTLKK
jgi:uncharacterized protein (TIGR00106 family)